jgi:polyhydroxyalkanoate synthase subunit PhaC
MEYGVQRDLPAAVRGSLRHFGQRPARFGYSLAGSGHIAGAINPPYRTKYSHWTDGPAASNVETWLAKAAERPGSWWPHWLQWIREHDPAEVSARKPGGGRLKPLEDAPGSYVKVSG